MTIKHKLLLSNIFVIVFPILVVVIIGFIFLFTFYGINTDMSAFPRTSQINCMSTKDAEQAVKENDYQILPSNVTIYQNKDNSYIIAFDDTENMPVTYEYPHIQRHTFMIGLLLSIILIYIINRLIAKQIMKSIVTPLDILGNGVHEISIGNLDYRIDYTKNDEFSSVCTAFNNMATRLHDMTMLQQKEEQNRKILIAGISHDLRTPLTSIKAYVVGLETGIATSPEMQKKYLSTINQKTTELEYIINQLFLFSKLDVGDFPFQMEPVNIGAELEQLIEDMEDEYLQKGVTIVCSQMPTDAVSTVDAIQFGNVVQNIWSNTAKYKDKPEVISTVSCEIKEDELVLVISDNGPGVPSEALDKMFDVFYRADASRQNVALGSGLGLAISAKIINRFNGFIEASNLPSGGLCITITLPLTGSDASPAQTRPIK